MLRRMAGGVSIGRKRKNRTAQAQKTRKAVSRTQTTTKTKKSSGGDDQHSGIGSRNVTLKLHPSLKGQGYSTWKFAQNYAGTIAGNAGVQAVSLIMGVCLRNQFITDTATPGFAQIRQNLFDLNASRAITGSALIPAPLLKPATDRLCVYNVRTNFMFTNLESVGSILTLYFVTPKRDAANLSDVQWANAMSGEGLTVPLRTRSLPGVYGGTTAGSGSTSDVFSKPTEFRLFKDMWRVMRVIRLRLAAGATEEVNVTSYINKMVKLQTITEQAVESLRGLTIQCIAVAYGQVVHDNGGAATMTTASTKIGFVETCTYTCGLTKAVGATRLDDYFTNQQIPVGTLPAAQMNIDIQDVVAAVDQA